MWCAVCLLHGYNFREVHKVQDKSCYDLKLELRLYSGKDLRKSKEDWINGKA